MDARLYRLAARQEDVVAAWQLLALGWTRRMIDYRVQAHRWRVIHPGVYVLSASPISQRQRWIAATLTSTGTALSHLSAAAFWGIREYSGRVQFVTRRGGGGRRRSGNLIVYRSSSLDGAVIRRQGILVTTPARVLIDLAPSLGAGPTARLFREALRLRVTTIARVTEALVGRDGRRGTPLLRDLSSRYAQIPYGRTRSDAEALALERLVDAGIELPAVNVRVAGEEADLVFAERKVIIEIDGPQYHQFREEDERKERAWRAAGFEVRRLSSDAVYHRPAELIRLARR